MGYIGMCLCEGHGFIFSDLTPQVRLFLLGKGNLKVLDLKM